MSSSNKLKIYQVELTNVCNARCTWCPYTQMKREQGFIDIMTIKLLIHHMKETGQKYIALHHMGEPLLHPELGKIIGMFNKANIETEFSTNGKLLLARGEIALAMGIKRIRIAVDYFYNEPGYLDSIKKFLKIAAHYPETEIRLHTVNGYDLECLKVESPVANQFVYEYKTFDNWAGAIEGESKIAPSESCYFLDKNYAVLLWDGNIVSCCMDYDATNVIGHINYIRQVEQRADYLMCKGCQKMQFASDGGWEL